MVADFWHKYVVFGLLLLVWNVSSGQQKKSNLDFVDPSIGGVGHILEPTRPTVHLPNSMVRVYPIRKDEMDDQIFAFPLTNASHRLAPLFSLMPVSGEVNEQVWEQRFSFSHEKKTPYFYTVDLDENDCTLEFSPAARSGLFKISFGGNKPHALRLGMDNAKGEINTDGKRIISGEELFFGMKAYFYAEVNQDISTVSYRAGTEKRWALVDFGSKPQTVEFRYGISFVSIEQARENLQKEIPVFGIETVKKEAFQAWDKVLSQISVRGGTDAQKRVFYTSLYRCYERMIDISEYGKYYSAYDHKIHNTKEPFFVDNWLWDTYIALEPLHMILNPATEANKIRSYIEMYKQTGWMPSFALIFGDWPAMVGNHAANWMADAWFKGIRDFDVKLGYEGVKKNSLKGTIIPWRNGAATSLDSFYNEKGYMPGLRADETETETSVDTNWEKRQAVSVTLEASYNDWAIAQLAQLSGNEADKEVFLKRAGNYRNVYRADKGFMWPKDSKGMWIEPYNPGVAGREFFTENNAYTYNWHVKHDLDGLFGLMGGRKKAEDKLDQLFREDIGLPKFRFWTTLPDASGLTGQFSMGNEPSLHIPYLYNYTGSPWKTQKRIRMLLNTWFRDDLFGMPGDEDGGGITSFVVFSMMGFFPSVPGIPVYTIGSPVFEQINISLPGGKMFSVDAKNNSETNKYIQDAKLNGKPLTRAWFTHDDLKNGGKLDLTMGPEPNREWGSKEADLPPSSMDYNPLKSNR